MRTIFLALVLLLPGCGATPYIDLGLGVRSDKLSDEILDSSQSWSGRMPTAEIALGIEWDDLFESVFFEDDIAYCEAYHWSHLRDGGPWSNNHPELYELKGRCNYRHYFGDK